MESKINIPNVSLSQFILDKCKEFGNKVALIDAETDRKLTFNDCISLVNRIANGLLKEGFEKGDTLLMFSPSCLEYPCCILAVAALGGTLQAGNPRYTTHELKHAFSICRPAFVITSPDLVNAIRDINCTDIRKLITFGTSPGCLSFETLISSGNSPIPSCDIDPARDTATQLFSSGTTGLPKSVQISHRNMVTNILQLIPTLKMNEGEIVLCFLPFFHIYAVILFLTGLATGTCTVVMKRFHPQQFIDNIIKYQCNHLSLVPPVMVLLTKMLDCSISDKKLSSVKSILCGAAPLSKEVEDKVSKIFCLNFITQGYGMTESLVTHTSTEQHNKYGSVGKTIPMTECKIVNPESGKSVGSNTRGEVCVRGQQVMLGYLSNPVATSSTIDSDGWLHTGDIGYIDDEDFLFIVDRIKELIKYKAFQVAPAELEEVLLQHPKVADVGVIGIPDHDAGELPKAFVVKIKGADVTEDELKTFIAERLSQYKQLRGGVEFITEIPKSASGKILRRILREREQQKNTNCKISQ